MHLLLPLVFECAPYGHRGLAELVEALMSPAIAILVFSLATTFIFLIFFALLINQILRRTTKNPASSSSDSTPRELPASAAKIQPSRRPGILAPAPR